MWLWTAMLGFGSVLASLYEGRWVYLPLIGMLLLALIATFALPKVRRRAAL